MNMGNPDGNVDSLDTLLFVHSLCSLLPSLARLLDKKTRKRVQKVLPPWPRHLVAPQHLTKNPARDNPCRGFVAGSPPIVSVNTCW